MRIKTTDAQYGQILDEWWALPKRNQRQFDQLASSSVKDQNTFDLVKNKNIDAKYIQKIFE